MMFGRNIRDKLPDIHQPIEIDEEVADRDKSEKEKGKAYADERRNAKISDIQEGDEVLVKRVVKTNKLQSTFEPDEYIVVARKGAELTIENKETNKRYRRNVAHVKKIERSPEPIAKRLRNHNK